MYFRAILLPLFAAFLVSAADTPLEKEARDLMRTGQDAQAFALVEQGAARHQPDAINFLAWFYDQGRFVKQDRAKAEELYRNAAGLGVPYSQWRLGVMIDEGLAKKGSVEDAVDLFRRAAAQNFSNAWVSLGVMQSRGRGTAQDFAAALNSYKMGARLGNIHAFNEIGVVYWQGEGVEADPIEAGAWFMVAAAHDDQVAPRYLGMLLDKIGNGALPAITARANTLGKEYGLLSTPITQPVTVG